MSVQDSSGGTGERNFLLSRYADRFGEPRFAQEAYGYWLFVAGSVLGVVALAVFVLADTSSPGSERQLAAVLGGVALPLVMLAVVYRLPVKRKVDAVALVGAIICFVGVAGFVYLYPADWNVAADTMDRTVAAVYGLGLLILAFSALVLPAVTETRDLQTVESTASEPTSEPTAEKSKAKLELYKDKAGEWRWNLRHNNGNIIADSAEGYSSKQKAKQGMESVRKNIVGAPVSERATEAAPEADDGDESRAVYEIYEDNADEWRWRLKAPNGRIIADSGQGYSDRRDAEAAIGKLRANASDADHLDITPAGFEVYKDKADEWRWRLIRQNGRILADSGEGYTERNDAAEAVERVRGGNGETEVYEDDAGEYRWRLEASNGRITADSAEGYVDEQSAKEAADRFSELAPKADTIEGGGPYFTVYNDEAGEWRWRYVASNGRIVADSGEGYTERNDAVEALERVKEYSTAPAS